jgi:transcriptional regulator with PAS, ATPase and Fis domain
LEVFEQTLLSSLCTLFPGREARVDVLDGRLHVAVSGVLDGEQQAVLRTLSAVAALGRELVPQAAAAPTLDEADVELPGFLAVSNKMRQLKRELAQLARSNATILVTGESGSGKEVVARAVHDLSSRSQNPYVTFNCASVPRELFESQLFGHKKGAFTGATADSPGVIRAAQGGTLFLDEVAELPLDTQPKLLRFLENAEVLPIGEQTPRRVNVRIVAATHRDLGRLVREGAFREDLYYRLNVVPLHIPPLRDRKEDVVALARMFLRRLTIDAEEPPLLANDAVRVLQQHTWPGNVRELRNVLERAMAYHPVPRVLGVEELRLVSRPSSP